MQGSRLWQFRPTARDLSRGGNRETAPPHLSLSSISPVERRLRLCTRPIPQSDWPFPKEGIGLPPRECSPMESIYWTRIQEICSISSMLPPLTRCYLVLTTHWLSPAAPRSFFGTLNPKNPSALLKAHGPSCLLSEHGCLQ